MNRILAAAIACTLPFAAQAHEYALGDLEVAHPYAFETTPIARSGAGYMTITNHGEASDALIAVKADFPRVTVHQSQMENGTATMTHTPRIDIPAGETVTFEPGGYHIMFSGLEAPFEEGARIPATLVFEKAGEVEVTFNVQVRDEGEADSRDSHGAGHMSH